MTVLGKIAATCYFLTLITVWVPAVFAKHDWSVRLFLIPGFFGAGLVVCAILAIWGVN